ncbi:hypothetical protein N781_12785 [Pontibacillus halophilus JSM 076056 = DSM 19796]|uniref:tRNA(Met) cytidine acetate ligase n=1 Tax=Pontibacillus halophilus JSM 076056 = DSM 19796 TaxID=1385510 RepID=A0A0A5GPU9_9BACI|nr:nucleotidyltransferase [Pontibacillus halophilus]KGX93278.1 hypothetical protein N781_12785 [Pontibacillus halophilus JSM 076056 = DSM 19796]
MNATGLVVEYNPFHNGHAYHAQQAKEQIGNDCTIAVMSGNFLQRGEPSIIDKWHRAEAALREGVDLVVELPYVFAVQNSDLFAKGALLTLDALGTDAVCFGSEQGSIAPFLEGYDAMEQYKDLYEETVRNQLDKGLSFPEASRYGYEQIGLTSDEFDLRKPNNILGFGYVKAIKDLHLSIKPTTVQRIHNDYHDEEIRHTIASATSIRKELLQAGTMTQRAKSALPESSVHALQSYRERTSCWHSWEHYFPFLQYRILTMSVDELSEIAGVEEGLQHRIYETIRIADSFEEWMTAMKTKRYTRTRLQRMATHVLTHTKKEDLLSLQQLNEVPYVRILGMNALGKSYMRQVKKEASVPLLTQPQQFEHSYLTIEERAMDAYLSSLPPSLRKERRKREFQPPILPKKM